jgi:hypothetical protein
VDADPAARETHAAAAPDVPSAAAAADSGEENPAAGGRTLVVDCGLVDSSDDRPAAGGDGGGGGWGGGLTALPTDPAGRAAVHAEAVAEGLLSPYETLEWSGPGSEWGSFSDSD